MKRSFLTMAVLLLSATTAMAANYIKPLEMKQAYEGKKPMIIVDIQTAADFTKQHLPGSIETDAYPVKSVEDKQRLDKSLATINASADPVVIICPRGKGAAKSTYEYLLSRGVAESRLLILEDGIQGWPYQDMLKKGK